MLVYEPEADCRTRLSALNISEEHALQISSYLAQSTDMIPEFPTLKEACSLQGISFVALTLNSFAKSWDQFTSEETLVWTLTDGIAFFAGSLAPPLARLDGMKHIGAQVSTFTLCQDKFRAGAVLQALGIPMPATALVCDGNFISPRSSLDGVESFFIKPNRLGSKIGIYENSHCHSINEALELSKRIFADYGDAAVLQAYVPGANVRASWLDVDGSGDLARHLGIWRVDSSRDFQTMEDSMALYGDTGAEAKAKGLYTELELINLRVENPTAATAILEIAKTLMQGLGLADVFSMDFRVEKDGKATLIEFEVCPGLPCFDFREYVKKTWNMPLPTAMATLAARILGQ